MACGNSLFGGNNNYIKVGNGQLIDIKYEPGKYENKSPIYINDRVITFGYYGIGKWIDGKMDNDDYLNMKNNISEWINTKSWGDKVTFGVVAKSFWLKIYIKLK